VARTAVDDPDGYQITASAGHIYGQAFSATAASKSCKLGLFAISEAFLSLLTLVLITKTHQGLSRVGSLQRPDNVDEYFMAALM